MIVWLALALSLLNLVLWLACFLVARIVWGQMKPTVSPLLEMLAPRETTEIRRSAYSFGDRPPA